MLYSTHHDIHSMIGNTLTVSRNENRLCVGGEMIVTLSLAAANNLWAESTQPPNGINTMIKGASPLERLESRSAARLAQRSCLA